MAGKRIDRRFQDTDAWTKHDLSAIKAEIVRNGLAIASQNAAIVRNGLAIASQQRKHLDVEADVCVNTLAIERARSQEGPKAAKIAQKFWLIQSTGRDNARAHQAMSAGMTVMNNTLEKLTLNR